MIDYFAEIRIFEYLNTCLGHGQLYGEVSKLREKVHAIRDSFKAWALFKFSIQNEALVGLGVILGNYQLRTTSWPHSIFFFLRPVSVGTQINLFQEMGTPPPPLPLRPPFLVQGFHRTTLCVHLT